MRKTALLFISIISITACKQSDYSLFDDFIEKYMLENHVPGLACAIIKEGDVSWAKAYGLADVKKEVPMSTRGTMNVASITKTITATAIMQLWERGEIDLDQDINVYLPEGIRNPNFPAIPITVRQLLTHTSSLVDGSAYHNSYSCGDPSISLKEWMLSYFYAEGEFYSVEENFLLKKPGEESQYSNVGYGLLGYIVEEITKILFSEYCWVNIFEPLGMNSTGFYLSETDLSVHILPHFYISEDSKKEILNDYTSFFPEEKEFSIGSYVAPCLYSFPNYPDGLMRTSVEDLSFFLAACINGGSIDDIAIIQSSTMDKMLSLQIEGNDSQGLCWHKSTFESMWGHGGGDPGVKTSMHFSPDTKIGIIIFQNSGQGNQFSILEKLYSLAEKN